MMTTTRWTVEHRHLRPTARVTVVVKCTYGFHAHALVTVSASVSV